MKAENSKPFEQKSGEIQLEGIYGDIHTFSRILYTIILVISLGLIAGIFIVLPTGNVISVVILGSALISILVIGWFVQRRYFETAAFLMAAIMIIMNTILASSELGIHHISNFAFPAILIVASLITQKRIRYFLVILTIFCLAWLVFGELWGLYAPKKLVQSAPGDFFSASVIITITAVLIGKLTDSLFQSFNRLYKEVHERTRIEESLRQREVILESVAFAAEQFLKTPNWRENMDIVLERFGKTIHATHAYLFEHHLGPNNQRVDSMRYEWTAPGYSSDLDNPNFQNTPIDEENFEHYNQILNRGEIFAGNLSSFPPAEREHFSALGIKSILEVPLKVNGAWWGTIGFDDFENEREWDMAEMEALKIAAGILQAAIQREKADSAVHESERIYRQAIEAAGAVPYFRDYRENQHIFIGNGIEKILGYKPEEMTVQKWLGLVKETIPLGEAEGLPLEEAIQRSRSGKLSEWKSDLRVNAHNGEERWLSDSAIELFKNSDISYASIGILQDITDRKNIEFNLRKHESLLEAVTFSAEKFLKAGNWRSKIEMVLERLGQEFGASHSYLFQKHPNQAGEVLSSMIYEWTAPGMETDLDSPEFQNMPANSMGFERLYHILDSGEPLVGSASFFTETEKEYLHSINIRALLEIRVIVNGSHWGTLGVDDILQEREWTPMEVDVIKVAASVLGAAIERQLNEDLLESELAERKKLIGELESKNNELERFTYTVSHDLKSPLVTISGFLGYLEKDRAAGNEERATQDIKRIRDAIEKMQKLLKDLLELSRVGRIMNPSVKVSFDDLIHDALEIVHGNLEARQVRVQIQSGFPTVFGDKPRLVEVLQNLIENAAKYMGDQKEPLIEIGVRKENETIFFVKDNGIGVAPEFQYKIFELFTKLDTTSEGTGVGLALVKRIIEFHGGKIWVESQVGAGATFCFTLSGTVSK
ncbi:MAG TPA: ATP-binding protein [Anaerolineales bacterium]|nr:ATP-binding protein [Anaerolineales bacterium]